MDQLYLDYLLNYTDFFKNNLHYIKSNIKVLEQLITQINNNIKSDRDFENFKSYLQVKTFHVRNLIQQERLYGVYTAIDIIHVQAKTPEECSNLLLRELDTCKKFHEIACEYPEIASLHYEG